jgi:hypothetical protein
MPCIVAILSYCPSFSLEKPNPNTNLISMNNLVKPVSPRYLVLDEISPCDILICFRGKYMPLITKGEKIGQAALEKLEKARIRRIYIPLTSVDSDWTPWIKSTWNIRQAGDAKSSSETTDPSNIYGNKRAELISYLSRTIVCRKPNEAKLNETFERALDLFQRGISAKSLDWYFNKFHEPPELFQHCGRVAFGSLLFALQFGLLSEQDRVTLSTAALIHELEGNLKDNRRVLLSEATLKNLEKAGHPIPQEVLSFLKMQDELWSGNGSPKKLAGSALPLSLCVFSLFNSFDQIRAEKTGTRRVRFDQTKKELTIRAKDFHPDLWPDFWSFWEVDWEIVS